MLAAALDSFAPDLLIVDKVPRGVFGELEQALHLLRAKGRTREVLHDGQIVVDKDGNLTLLDLDTVAIGDPALDLANLAAHLDLGCARGAWNVRQAETAQADLIDGYGAGAATIERMAQHKELARMRLVAVYAYRPREAAIPERLLMGSSEQ